MEVWPVSCQRQLVAALHAPGTFQSWQLSMGSQTPGPSHQGTSPVGPREGVEAASLPRQAGPGCPLMSRKVGGSCWLSLGLADQAGSRPLTTAWSLNAPAGHQGPGQGLLGPRCSIFCLLISSLCFVPRSHGPFPQREPPWDGSAGRELGAGTNYFQMPLVARPVRDRHRVFSHCREHITGAGAKA